MEQYDVVILGAGLGGMLCATLLAQEGMRVAVIEQNKQVGGCLQTFSFDKKVFDSCVHYIGAMDEGQTQRRIFDFAGISAQLNLRKLDEDCFDEIIFGNAPQAFPQAQGLTHFVASLQPYFPQEQTALRNYTDLLQYVGNCFPLYNLRNGNPEEKTKISGWSIAEGFQKAGVSPQLQHVLCGNNLLYAGQRYQTPFYVHALVMKSYIDSAYKCTGGSAQIAKALWKRIQKNGGVIFRNEKVEVIGMAGDRIKYAQTRSGERYYGKHFIANIHPAQLLQMLHSDKIKPAYKNRVERIPNSVSACMLNLILKPGTVRYHNHNIYWNRSTDPFDAVKNVQDGDVHNYALYFTEDPKCPGYAESLAVLTYMDASATQQWGQTHNRSAEPAERCEQYETFKMEKASVLLEVVGQRYPEISKNVQSFKVATPLTFRDYMGTADGSMYGTMTDVSFPEASRIPIKTRIPNLFFTGQNVNLHGVLGVSITAIATCGALTGLDYLLKKMQ